MLPQPLFDGWGEIISIWRSQLKSISCALEVVCESNNAITISFLACFSLCFGKVALSDISDEMTGYTPDERRVGSETSNHGMHRQFTKQRVKFYFQNNWMPHWSNSTPWQEMKENPYPLGRKHPSRPLEPPGNIQCTLMSARGAKAEGVPFLCKIVAPIDSYPFLHAFLTDWWG